MCRSVQEEDHSKCFLNQKKIVDETEMNWSHAFSCTVYCVSGLAASICCKTWHLYSNRWYAKFSQVIWPRIAQNIRPQTYFILN